MATIPQPLKPSPLGTAAVLSGNNPFIAVRVADIILDINHPQAKKYGGYDAIGTIFYGRVNGGSDLSKPELLPVAKPLFSFIKHFPLLNEIVFLITSTSKNIYSTDSAITNYYMPSINAWTHPHHNALPLLSQYRKNSQTQQDYKITEAGIVRQIEDNSSEIPLGKYFREQINIKPLLPYEGDSILEGRFGNSIRIGSTAKGASTQPPWSEAGENGDPIIIIRNGQSKELDDKGWVNTIENINQDDSSIYLTSNQKISNLTVAIAKSPVKLPSYGAEFEKPVDPIQNLTDIPLKTITQQDIITSDLTTDIDNILTPPTIEEENKKETIEDKEFNEFAELMATGLFEEDDFILVETEDLKNETPISYNEDPIIPPSYDATNMKEVNLGEGIGKYFKLKHFTRSNTATKNNINNIPGIDAPEYTSDFIIDNLKSLSEDILDKIVDEFGNNVQITSGYRAKELNSTLGGSSTSQHRLGQAVDIQIPGIKTADIFNWVIDNISVWDQIIWEFPERGAKSWIHISYGGQNRKQKLLASKDSDLRKKYNGNSTYTNIDRAN